jgi:hypothetical protein
VIEKNRSVCKYVEIFTHRVGSIGAPSRRTVFIRGTSTKREDVPNIESRSLKTNTFQEGSTGFKKRKKKKKIMHQGDVSVYVKNVDLIFQRQIISVRNIKEKKR